jgi:hypothetical protein
MCRFYERLYSCDHWTEEYHPCTHPHSEICKLICSIWHTYPIPLSPPVGPKYYLPQECPGWRHSTRRAPIFTTVYDSNRCERCLNRMTPEKREYCRKMQAAREEALLAAPILRREEEAKRLEGPKYTTWEHSRTFTRKNLLTCIRQQGLERAEKYILEAKMMEKDPSYRHPELQSRREFLARSYMPYAGDEAWPLWELAETEKETFLKGCEENDAYWAEVDEKRSRIWDVRCDAGPDDPVERAGGEVVVASVDDIFPLLAPRNAYAFEGVGIKVSKAVRRPESRFRRKERYKTVIRDIPAMKVKKSARPMLPLAKFGARRTITAPVFAVPELDDEPLGIYRVLKYGKYERCHEIIRDKHGLSRELLTPYTETQFSKTRWFEPD